MLVTKFQMRSTRPLSSQAPCSSRSPAVLPLRSTRRDLLAMVAGLSVLVAPEAFAADQGNSTASTSEPGSFISITPINNDAKDFMDRRDDAMEYKCKGGMFDCDGDRRDFAKKQYQEWLDAGGVPKRIRDGRPEGPRAF